MGIICLNLNKKLEISMIYTLCLLEYCEIQEQYHSLLLIENLKTLYKTTFFHDAKQHLAFKSYLQFESTMTRNM